MSHRTATVAILLALGYAACARRAGILPAPQPDPTHVDTVAISNVARELSSDAMRGRGPWTPENAHVARRLAADLERLGARPVFGGSLLVPFVADSHPRDTSLNVVGVLPNREGGTTGELVGITAHLDHLGVGVPDATGDSIYNGFLDDALSIAMILDLSRRYAQTPGDRPLVVLFFNLEEQGLLGSKALVTRPDARPFLARLKLLVEVDAGSPAGEALEWQLVGGSPSHAGAVLADSLARARGWTTTATPPRPISDFYPFAQLGVRTLFPIPGARWKGYSDAQRAEAMKRFDHYHDPKDEWRADFPWAGTERYADWLWAIVRGATDRQWRP
jgi:Zn-dependent M28 family amino/carboxypeptidase